MEIQKCGLTMVFWERKHGEGSP